MWVASGAEEILDNNMIQQFQSVQWYSVGWKRRVQVGPDVSQGGLFSMTFSYTQAQSTIRRSEQKKWKMMFMEHLLWAGISLDLGHHLRDLSEMDVIMPKTETC